MIMKKNSKYLIAIGSLLMLLIAACEDDEFQFPVSEPLISTSSETISSLPGGDLTLEATLTDPVGLQSVEVVYTPWNLTETISLSGAEEHLLSYVISVPNTEPVGSTHDILITATNVNGVIMERVQRVVLNQDETAPVISNNTQAGVAFLGDGTDATLEISVSDNLGIATFTIVGPSFSESIQVGANSYSYSRDLNVQQQGLYNFEITVEDEWGNSAEETVTIVAYEPFEKMYLADVSSDEELLVDLMGVPRVMNSFDNEDSLGKVFVGYYYNAQENTEIRLLPSKESFSPLTFGASSQNGVMMVAPDATVSPIILPNIGYTKLSVDFRDMSYTVEPYTPEDEFFETVVFHGSDGILINGESICCWNPAVGKALTRDTANPYVFTGTLELFDASADQSGLGGSFILGASTEGWSPFWRFDNGSSPDATVPNGGDNYSFGPEAYGTYDVTFDTHLNRIEITPNN